MDGSGAFGQAAAALLRAILMHSHIPKATEPARAANAARRPHPASTVSRRSIPTLERR